MERYTPKELDIPFPEITAINIGMCPGTETHYREVSSFEVHTHMCRKDIYYRNICLYEKQQIFNSDGSISDILWHEYAHVLDTYNQETVKVISCNSYKGMHEFEYLTYEDSKNFGNRDGHGLSWENIMRRLGKKPTRIVVKPY